LDKYLEALRAAGVADSIVLTFVLFIVVAPVFWKLMKEAVSLRRTARKDKLEGVFEVLSNEGINSHPLRVELAFRELFNRFFVTSCGFGLIEQAAHWAANQVDHGDEVGLVPVAACA